MATTYRPNQAGRLVRSFSFIILDSHSLFQFSKAMNILRLFHQGSASVFCKKSSGFMQGSFTPLSQHLKGIELPFHFNFDLRRFVLPDFPLVQRALYKTRYIPDR